MPRVDLSNQHEIRVIVIGARNYADDHKSLVRSPAVPAPVELMDGDRLATIYKMEKPDSAKAVRAFTTKKIYMREIGQRFMLENEMVLGAYNTYKREFKIFKMRLQKTTNGRGVRMANPRLMITYHDIEWDAVRDMEPMRLLLKYTQTS